MAPLANARTPENDRLATGPPARRFGASLDLLTKRRAFPPLRARCTLPTCKVAVRPVGFTGGRLFSSLLGIIAQLGERLLCTQEVVGSIPTGSTLPQEETPCPFIPRVAAPGSNGTRPPSKGTTATSTTTRVGAFARTCGACSGPTHGVPSTSLREAMFREAPDLKPQTVCVLDGHCERIRRMRRAAAIGAGQPVLTAAFLFLVAAFSTDGIRPSTWIAAACLGATSALVIAMHRGYTRRVTLETLEATRLRGDGKTRRRCALRCYPCRTQPFSGR